MPHHINLVQPYEMRTPLLLSEIEAIPAVVHMVRKALKRGATFETIIEKIPGEYLIGTGHLVFFYDKLTYLSKRRDLINDQLKIRGYPQVRDEELRSVNNDIPNIYWNDYEPSSEEIRRSLDYIRKKLSR